MKTIKVPHGTGSNGIVIDITSNVDDTHTKHYFQARAIFSALKGNLCCGTFVSLAAIFVVFAEEVPNIKEIAETIRGG